VRACVCVCARARVIECSGTSEGMTMSGLFHNDPFKAHAWYERHYTNCTHVLTNLEIANLNPLNGTSLNVSFLENIREVRMIIGSLNSYWLHRPKLVDFRPQRVVELCVTGVLAYRRVRQQLFSAA
jgi:hypothetical protein